MQQLKGLFFSGFVAERKAATVAADFEAGGRQNAAAMQPRPRTTHVSGVETEWRRQRLGFPCMRVAAGSLDGERKIPKKRTKERE